MAPTPRRLQLLSNLERKYHLPRGILYGQWGAETGFAEGGGSQSGAGAVGPFQFLPSTAAGMGVNPRNFASAAKGAARYDAQYRDRGFAGLLAAYNAGPAGNAHNPETQGYIKRVRGYAQQAPYEGGGQGGASASFQLQTRNALDRQGFDQAQRRFELGQILGDARSPFQSFGPRAAISAPNPLLQALPQTEPQEADFTRAVTSLRRLAGGLAVSAPSGQRGKAIVAPGADRAGVPTSKVVRDFVGLVAGSVGHPITITTGSNHSQMTTSGNVSDHWTGRAADIGVPVDSQQGDMIAGRALLLAGVPREQARKMAQQGGLFTLTPRSGPLAGRRVQVIWKTYEGGDHHNHVHIGIE
jgi:hypothetical protein